MSIRKLEERRSEPETWKPVADWPGYEVSSFGRLLNVKRDTIVTTIHSTILNKRLSAAEATLLAFVGPRPYPDAKPRYKDGNRHNLYWKNLSWAPHNQRRFTNQSVITPEEYEEIIEKVRQRNKSFSEIAADYGIDLKLVSHFAKQAGLSRPETQTPTDIKVKEKILNLLNTKKTYEQIAVLTGVSEALVHKIAKSAKIDRISTWLISEQEKLQILEMALDGFAFDQIAKQLQITRGSVSKHLKIFINSDIYSYVLFLLETTSDYNYIGLKTKIPARIIAKISRFKRKHNYPIRKNPDSEIHELQQRLATGDESVRDLLINHFVRMGVSTSDPEFEKLIQPYETQMEYDFGSRFDHLKPEEERSPVLVHPIADIDYGQYFGPKAGAYAFFEKWGFKFDPTLTIIASRVENAPYIAQQARLGNYIDLRSNDPRLPTQQAFKKRDEILARLNAEFLPSGNNYRGNHRLQSPHGDLDIIYRLFRIPTGYLMLYWNLSVSHDLYPTAVNAFHFFRRDGFGAPNF